MNSTDLLELCGLLTSAWAVGFAGGYVLTRFKEGLNQIV